MSLWDFNAYNLVSGFGLIVQCLMSFWDFNARNLEFLAAFPSLIRVFW